MLDGPRKQMLLIETIAAALGISGVLHPTGNDTLSRVLTSINLCQQPGNTIVPWRVYLLRCSNQALYCGATVDMVARLKKHRDGTASKFTRSFLPVELVMVSLPMQHGVALSLEAKIKQYSANRKIETLGEFVDQRLLDEFRREGTA